MKRKNTARKMSGILVLHYCKLVYRSVLFLTAVVIYIINRVNRADFGFEGIKDKPFILILIWTIFAIEMILRLFPSKLESMGCQKQFARNYMPKEQEKRPELLPAFRTAMVAGTWVVLNGIIGILYFTGIIDAGILLLISLAYSVCDIVCILFFCPFQTWFMKNRCCATCRIYNWDYAMMFTPLIFVRSMYTGTLVVLSLILLVKWEYLLHRYPERFSENTNQSLMCSECKEKLCHHKTQLRRFWAKNINLRSFLKDSKK